MFLHICTYIDTIIDTFETLDTLDTNIDTNIDTFVSIFLLFLAQNESFFIFFLNLSIQFIISVIRNILSGLRKYVRLLIKTNFLLSCMAVLLLFESPLESSQPAVIYFIMSLLIGHPIKMMVQIYCKFIFCISKFVKFYIIYYKHQFHY